MPLVLFENLIADGSGQELDFSPGVMAFGRDGPASIYLEGDLGGGTVVLEAVRPGGAVFVPVAGPTMDAAKSYDLRLRCQKLRATLTGATNPNVSGYIT